MPVISCNYLKLSLLISSIPNGKDTLGVVTITARFDARKASKGGYYLGGYIVEMDPVKAEKLKGKIVKVSGKV